MTQYKTIAGPIGVKVERGEDYEEVVKRYAAIVDAEAVGGWDLSWIQQIPVIKVTTDFNGVMGLAVIGAVLGYVSQMGVRGESAVAIAICGAVIGGAIGYTICKKNAIEWFNMLVFAKKE